MIELVNSVEKTKIYTITLADQHQTIQSTKVLNYMLDNIVVRLRLMFLPSLFEYFHQRPKCKCVILSRDIIRQQIDQSINKRIQIRCYVCITDIDANANVI